MAAFDYGTAEGVHFKIGDKVVINTGIIGIPEVYEVIEFNRTKGALANAPVSNNVLKRDWVTLKRLSNSVIPDVISINNLKLATQKGGKRRTRRHKRKSKKTRKSRSSRR
uniref:Uncharacterized protein n=1 Tax=viral metagenome TaxID=1070528 RepID=A0A6C0K1I1_9ZZZZ